MYSVPGVEPGKLSQPVNLEIRFAEVLHLNRARPSSRRSRRSSATRSVVGAFFVGPTHCAVIVVVGSRCQVRNSVSCGWSVVGSSSTSRGGGARLRVLWTVHRSSEWLASSAEASPPTDACRKRDGLGFVMAARSKGGRGKVAEGMLRDWPSKIERRLEFFAQPS